MKLIIIFCFVCSFAFSSCSPLSGVPLKYFDSNIGVPLALNNDRIFQDVLEDELYTEELLPPLLYQGADFVPLEPVTDEETDNQLRRSKRQSVNRALDLALSHRDRHGNDRPVGRLHGGMQISGVAQNSRNWHAQGGAGLGSVLWRSNDRRHSLGAGAYASQARGRFQGFNYRSRPDVGVGLGYRFRF